MNQKQVLVRILDSIKNQLIKIPHNFFWNLQSLNFLRTFESPKNFTITVTVIFDIILTSFSQISPNKLNKKFEIYVPVGNLNKNLSKNGKKNLNLKKV